MTKIQCVFCVAVFEMEKYGPETRCPYCGLLYDYDEGVYPNTKQLIDMVEDRYRRRMMSDDL